MSASLVNRWLQWLSMIGVTSLSHCRTLICNICIICIYVIYVYISRCIYIYIYVGGNICTYGCYVRTGMYQYPWQHKYYTNQTPSETSLTMATNLSTTTSGSETPIAEDCTFEFDESEHRKQKYHSSRTTNWRKAQRFLPRHKHDIGRHHGDLD